MKKTLLATLIPALFFANSATAVELYQDEVNTFSIGGHLSAGLTDSQNSSTEVQSISPRININATRALGNGFTADARAEWYVNMLNGGDNAFYTRLGYLGLTHDVYGRAVVGTQWSPTYDVAGVADMPIAFANDFLYADMHNGSSRAENMVSYRNGFAFSDSIALNLGLGVQAGQTVESGEFVSGLWEEATNDYASRYQVALSLDVEQFSLGLAYNTGDVAYDGAAAEEVTLFNVSAKYGSYGEGLYVAAVYGANEFVAEVEESTDIELLVAYAFPNTVNVSVNYESSEDDTDGETLTETTAVQVEYNLLPSVVGYAGYQIDLSDDEDHVWAFGARIYL